MSTSSLQSSSDVPSLPARPTLAARLLRRRPAPACRPDLRRRQLALFARVVPFLLALVLALGAGAARAEDKVVYHIDDAKTQALKGLRNMRNQLDTEPTTKMIVVAHGEGVDFLLEGAKAANGSDYAGPVAALVARGVHFEVCEITLKNRKLTKDQFITEADFTPSGVVRVTRLQAEGYSYIKP